MIDGLKTNWEKANHEFLGNYPVKEPNTVYIESHNLAKRFPIFCPLALTAVAMTSRIGCPVLRLKALNMRFFIRSTQYLCIKLV